MPDLVSLLFRLYGAYLRARAAAHRRAARTREIHRLDQEH